MRFCFQLLLARNVEVDFVPYYSGIATYIYFNINNVICILKVEKSSVLFQYSLFSASEL